MDKNFTLSNLHSGFVVVLRSGKKMILGRAGSNFTKILIDKDGKWAYLSAWDNDLRVKQFLGHWSKNEPSWRPCYKTDDIVKVYGLVKSPAVYGTSSTPCTDERELLFAREEEKEYTLKDLEAILGCKIKIVG